MTREEELYWGNQPEWVVNAEMERRLKAYFASPEYLKKERTKICKDLQIERRNKQNRERGLELAIENLKKVI